MNEKEMLEIDIENLKDAYKRIKEALNDISDIDDITDEQYTVLYDIGEEINDLRISKENSLERLEETA